jgi:hypothetical protein
MSDMIRYGVFKVGQIWCVYGTTKERFGYMSREEALSAASAMASARRADGAACEVLLHHPNGRLAELPLLEVVAANAG